jgi:hypothetical protein
VTALTVSLYHDRKRRSSTRLEKQNRAKHAVRSLGNSYYVSSWMSELDSYLNDHLAGSVGALELLDHWIKLCDGKPLAKFFAGLKKEVEADQKTLREVMRTLGTKESSIRRTGAWVAEKFSRASLAIAGDESGGLDLVLALDTIAMGITGKKLLWRALAAADVPKTGDIDFVELERRAEEQIARVEVERLRAAREAFSGNRAR